MSFCWGLWIEILGFIFKTFGFCVGLHDVYESIALGISMMSKVIVCIRFQVNLSILCQKSLSSYHFFIFVHFVSKVVVFTRLWAFLFIWSLKSLILDTIVNILVKKIVATIPTFSKTNFNISSFKSTRHFPHNDSKKSFSKLSCMTFRPVVSLFQFSWPTAWEQPRKISK